MVTMELPDLFLFHGDWARYIEELYRIYLDEIVNGDLIFQGLPIKCQFRPESKGKGYGFWHVISDGPAEDERLPDLRRCERIQWISWIIRGAGHDSRISWWENKRGRSTNVVLWLEKEDFAVILAKRSRYYLLKTAYCLKPHRRKTFRKEKEAFWRKKTKAAR